MTLTVKQLCYESNSPRNRESNQQEDGYLSESPSNDLKLLVEPDEKDEGEAAADASLNSAAFNFVNSIVGSGVIGIPFALREAGFGLGLLLLVLVALVTDYSLVLMIRGGHLAGTFTYQGLMEAAFGRAGFVVLSLLQFVYPFVAMISYNVVVGDTATKVLVGMFGLERSSLLARREVAVGLATLFVTLPLCLYRDIGKLAKVSLFSLVCVGFILLAVVVKLFALFREVPSSPDAWQFVNWNIVPAMGIMTFAFMCHHNTFLIYGSIDRADQRRWDRVTHVSLFVSFLLAAMFGIAGYATFTGRSEGDLLENYCPDDDLMNAARIFFAITILLTYPIECFVTREVLENTLLRDLDLAEEGRTFWNRRFLATVTVVLATYFLSVTTDCLGVILELNGVLAAVPLAYILPGLCFLRLDASPFVSKAKLPALLLVLFGFLVVVFGLVSMADDGGGVANCSHGRVMDYCLGNASSVA